MIPTKAKIEVLDRDAIVPNGRLDRFLEVQFNPTEYTLNKGAQIAEIAIYGIDSPILQFVRGQNQKLTLDLLFDTTTTTSGFGKGAVPVTDKTKMFYELVKIQPKTHAVPRIQFTWGLGLSFTAIVESIQQKFTLFNPDGIPLRATLTVSFREYRTLEDQVAELKPQSPDHTKRRIVGRADTLSRIAFDEFGDPALWRAIADANPDLDDVRSPSPGTVLVIPPIDTLGRPAAPAAEEPR
jgi:hypothetical protein